VEINAFWKAFERILTDLGPTNKQLLKQREAFQAKIDSWHLEHRNQPHDHTACKHFLQEIGYLLPEGEEFSVTTTNVDPEIADVAGPQLVVPVMNPRYALNAANARWGSLYDALYGTDAIPETGGAEKTKAFNPVRATKVVEFAMGFLDEAAPLKSASHTEVAQYSVRGQQLIFTLNDGRKTTLIQADKFVGYKGDVVAPDSILLRNNGLHIELQIDRNHPIGKSHPAGVKDVVLEAAITTIQDCEDSVTAVDAEDKALIYGNLLGLMKGDLSATLEKGGKTINRTLNPDREYLAPNGDHMSLPGRSLLFVHMKNETWIHAYEDSNVDIGLACGLRGKAQIGKGMWAMPEEMQQMMEIKINHPLAGANTAWVSSPTAATLHALHYHKVNVQAQQKELAKRQRASIDDLLTLPLLGDTQLTAEEIQQELDNNAQGILGYVVRWIDQGVGCSTVPDINNIGLMEDRATLRISSQHIANWLHHGIASEAQVIETLQRMAAIVDQQNEGDPNYRNMAPDFDGIAFLAVRDLIFLGCKTPSGYTEPTLHRRRRELKALFSS
jgi:malate synthase